MDSEKVASLATMSGISGATIAGVGIATIGMYLAIGIVIGCAGFAVYKIGKTAKKSFSEKLSEKESAVIVG